METRALAVLVVTFCILSVPIAQADDNADLIKQIQDQKALLDAQKGLNDSKAGLLTSEKNLVDAQYPKFTGGKAGETTFGTSVDPFHANFYAYKALGSLASDLAGALFKQTTLTDKKVLVLSSDDLASIAAYRLLKNQLDELNKAYEASLKLASTPTVDLVPPTTPSTSVLKTIPIYTAAMALSSIADFTRLFHTDQKVGQEAVTLTDSDLANALIHANPAKFLLATSLVIPELLDEKNSKLWAEYNMANSNRVTVQALPSNMDANLAKQFTALLAKHTQLDTIFTGVNETTKEPNILRLLRGEALYNAYQTDNTVYLTANVVLKGGFSVVSQSIWRQDKFYSQGGVVVSYRAMDKEGKVLAADILSKELADEVKFH